MSLSTFSTGDNEFRDHHFTARAIDAEQDAGLRRVEGECLTGDGSGDCPNVLQDRTGFREFQDIEFGGIVPADIEQPVRSPTAAGATVRLQFFENGFGENPGLQPSPPVVEFDERRPSRAV